MPGRSSRYINICNSCLIELVDPVRTNHGQDAVIAKAVRANVNSSWNVGTMLDGKMTNIAEIFEWVPERTQRAMVMAILKEFM